MTLEKMKAKRAGEKPGGGGVPGSAGTDDNSNSSRTKSVVEKKIRSCGIQNWYEKYAIVFQKTKAFTAWIINAQLLSMILHKVCYYLDY